MKLLHGLSLGLLMSLPLSLTAHATGVVVADTFKAITQSNDYKVAAAALDQQIKPQEDKLKALKTEIEALQQRFERDGKIMSETDRKNLQIQAQTKLNEFQSIAEGVQTRRAKAQQEILQKLEGKVKSAVEQLRTELNYDVIVEAKYVVWKDPKADITDKLIEKINQAK